MWMAKTETCGVREDIAMGRLVVSVENKERDHHQMPRLSTLLGGMFHRADKPMREELDPVMHIFQITDPELYSDYRAARVIKDIGVRHVKTPEAAGATVPAGSPS